MFKKLFLAPWCLHGTSQFGCFQQKKKKSEVLYLNNDQRGHDLRFPKSVAPKGGLRNWLNPLEVFIEQYHLFLFI